VEVELGNRVVQVAQQGAEKGQLFLLRDVQVLEELQVQSLLGVVGDWLHGRPAGADQPEEKRKETMQITAQMHKKRKKE